MGDSDKILDSMPDSFKSLSGKLEILAEVIEFFPYPIQVYNTDGTSVLINKALMSEYHVSSPDMVVGKYNIFKDPSIIALGQIPEIRRAFQGETVFFHDIKVPLEDIAQRYGINDLDAVAVYQDITFFPILDDKKRVVYVVAFLINRRVYKGKDEIERAKEYIESHWLEKFDLDKVAKASCFSKAHLTKLFKKHTGITPHEYYMNYKIGKLKEKLMDTNLSVAEAFAACNIEYNGHSARIFKEKAGVSPSEYRKSIMQKELKK